MKAAVKLFTSIWDMLMDLQMFDLPFTFGQFLVALAFLDVAFISRAERCKNFIEIIRIN